jgi:hypothetical protein
MDKFGLLMDRHYFMENNELVKGGMQGRQLQIHKQNIRNCFISKQVIGSLGNIESQGFFLE